jgi:hypothetical protein
MFKLLLRFAGLWLVAGALVALVIDATRSIAASVLVFTPLATTIDAMFGPAPLASAAAFVEKEIGNWLWNPAISSLLALPTWVVLGALGFFFTGLGSRRRSRPRYA